MKSWRFILPAAGLFAVAAWAAEVEGPTCAVLTFDAKGGVTPDAATLLTDRFAAELNALGAYRIMPRERMGEILAAQEFARSCAAAQCAVEAGRILAIEKIIYGTVGVVGETHTVSAHVADIESGNADCSATYDSPGKIDLMLTAGMRELAARLASLSTSRGDPGVTRTGSPETATSPEPVLRMQGEADRQILPRASGTETNRASRPKRRLIVKGSGGLDWVPVRREDGDGGK